MSTNTKLFVRNLSWSVTEDELYDLFGAVGPVVSAKIPTRREDGKPRGFAFVEMASPEAAQAAIRQLHSTILHNRDMVVDFQDENKGGGSASGAPAKNSKLFIRNISYDAREADLQALFEQVGSVISIRIPADRETGEQKPFGFVEMTSVEEAQQAIDTLNGTHFHGKTLAIDFQDPDRSKNRPRPGSNYSRSGGYGRDRGSYAGQW